MRLPRAYTDDTCYLVSRTRSPNRFGVNNRASKKTLLRLLSRERSPSLYLSYVPPTETIRHATDRQYMHALTAVTSPPSPRRVASPGQRAPRSDVSARASRRSPVTALGRARPCRERVKSTEPCERRPKKISTSEASSGSSQRRSDAPRKPSSEMARAATVGPSAVTASTGVPQADEPTGRANRTRAHVLATPQGQQTGSDLATRAPGLSS